MNLKSKRIPDVEIKIDKVSYPNTFAEEILIDQTDLDAELVKQPERYGYYSQLAALAGGRKNLLKLELEQLIAHVDHEKRTHASHAQVQNPKLKFTEKMYEHEVNTDKRVVEKKKELLQATLLTEQLKEFSIAIFARKDSLIQLASNHRSVFASPRVKEEQEGVARQIIAANRTAKNEATEPQEPPEPPPPPIEENSGRRRRPRT